jgi:hypothetical protein
MRFPFLAILFVSVLEPDVYTSAMQGVPTQQPQSWGVTSIISQLWPRPGDDLTVIYDFINNEQHSAQSGEPPGMTLPGDLGSREVPLYNMPYRLFIPGDNIHGPLFLYPIWVNVSSDIYQQRRIPGTHPRSPSTSICNQYTEILFLERVCHLRQTKGR